MRVKRLICLLLLVCCGRKPAPIVNPDYVVFRSTANHAERIIDLRDLDPSSTRVQQREDAYVIVIDTTPDGGRRLEAWTSAHLEQRLDVLVGGHVISSPIVKSSIDRTIVLDGGFTKDQAKEIVDRIRNGGR